MKDTQFREQAISTIKRIKDLKLTTPLGLYSTPEYFIEVLEDYLKLLYDINSVDPNAFLVFSECSSKFDEFKEKLFELCDILIDKANHDNDTPKDKKASESA